MKTLPGKPETITVFGLGFVGLTTALGFAHYGYRVHGIDVNRERIDTLKSGKLPFLEPGMDEALKELLNKNFFVTEDVRSAVSDSDVIYYCVGTPYGKDGQADLTYLFEAMSQTLAEIEDDRFRVLVTKSTIPPSTTREKIVPFIRDRGYGAERIGIANNPEFLREGHCWDDFLHADRIVLGTEDDRSREVLTKLYEPMGIPVKCVSHTTGEFIKYLSNTMLATLISYANEMSEVADAIGGIEVAEAFKILHMDKRWGGCNMTSYVYPGCGYGGYCLPKDTNALLAQARVKGYEPQILKNAIRVNELRPETIAERIAGGLDQNACIGILGLAFKPLSDDVRDTPAAHIIRALADRGIKNIVAYDPEAAGNFVKSYPDLPVTIRGSLKEVYDEADVLAIVTAWEEFRKVGELGEKKVIDCRYML